MIAGDGSRGYRTVVPPQLVLSWHQAILPNTANISHVAMKINSQLIKYLQCLHSNIDLALRLLIHGPMIPVSAFRNQDPSAELCACYCDSYVCAKSSLVGIIPGEGYMRPR